MRKYKFKIDSLETALELIEILRIPICGKSGGIMTRLKEALRWKPYPLGFLSHEKLGETLGISRERISLFIEDAWESLAQEQLQKICKD